MKARKIALWILSFALLARGDRAWSEEPDSRADWPTYNHDSAGWRFNPAESTLGPENVGGLVELWRFPAEGSGDSIGVVHATPAVVGGEVYFGTATFPTFYKLGRDGKLLWSYRNPDRQHVEPPTVGANARDKLPSTLNQTFDIEPPPGTPPVSEKLRGAASRAGIYGSALVADGAVYFSDTGGWMYCLDAVDGSERWKVDARAPEFPGAHFNNMFMASPVLADDKIVFGGGTLEQVYAGTPGYPGCTGRGFLVALDPATGAILWKHDVGPTPEKLDPPIVIKEPWGEHTFEYGPATSSVWSTPSYDPETDTLFFGTDVNTAPRRPTAENPALHTEDSCAVAALDAATGKRKWNTQLKSGDVWTNSMCAYDWNTGLYKDQAIGDTPKILTVEIDGAPTKVVGVGCKDGGFYLLRSDNGKLIRHTPVYTGPPTEPPAEHDPRVLALPSCIGGLQSGCATDGRTIFTNGIDAARLGAQRTPGGSVQIPTGGRVTATSTDLATELWRHERPKIPEMGVTPGEPMYRDVGDIVGSGLAVGNGVAYFTAVGSGKLLALDTKSGEVLKEIDLGPVFAGPALSRGRVYVGGGNVLWTPADFECFFPKQYTGGVRCFGLPD